ncbi:hypothetical protein [Streptomyces sp. NPDC058424]|uniref:hypothetical protein n=1 Tax=Streptomyces sp. NPDC058424 TaxID=3346491 RepID=UPI0036535F5D
MVLTNRAAGDPGQQRLVEALLASGARAMRDPYDVMCFPQVPAYLTTYAFNNVAMRSLAGVLTGAIQPAARLPVTIPIPPTREHPCSRSVPASPPRELEKS